MTGALNALALFANFVIVPAAAYGSQLALGALGVTLVYAVLRFSNFAHGEIMSVGGMAAVMAVWGLQAAGVDIFPAPTALLALPAAVAVTVLTVLAADKLVFSHHRRRRSRPVVFMVASAGVMFVLNGLVRFIIGPDSQNMSDGARFLLKAREFKEMTGLSEGLAFKTSQALSIAAAFICVAALFWFLQKTRTGKSMRAYSDNEDLALLSGVNPDRVVMVTWVLAGALAAVAGTMFGLDKSYKPFVYMHLLIPIFAAAILGGISSPAGAVAGGYIVAFSEVVLTYAFKKVLAYLGWQTEGLAQFLATDYKIAVSFVILVIVLIVRPTGIFKGKTL